MRGTPTMIGNKKIASLAILKVLQEFSDEDHPLMHNDIIRLINKKYHVSLLSESFYLRCLLTHL